MASVGSAAAEGLQSGFGLGLQADAADLRRKQADFENKRQTLADQRSGEELGLKKATFLRGATADATAALGARQNELVEGSTAAQVSGMPVSPQDAAEYGANASKLAALRQSSLDFFSRAAAGQFDPTTAAPKDLYTNIVAATGMTPQEISTQPQNASDVQAGLQTGNQGLVIQGVNGLLTPQLRRGVGQPSPYGGMILSKEIIGLDPAIDANGQAHPNRVIPRLRVMTDVLGPDGKQLYYDAPMTAGGTTDPNDPPAAIDISKAMDWMGNVGAMANLIQHPEIAAKLKQGAAEVDPDTKRALDQLTGLGQLGMRKQLGPFGQKLLDIQMQAKREGLTTDEVLEKYQGILTPGVGAATVRAKLDAIDGLDIPDDQKESLKRDVVLGAGGKTTGLTATTGLAGGVRAVADYAKAHGMTEDQAAAALKAQGLIKMPTAGAGAAGNTLKTIQTYAAKQGLSEEDAAVALQKLGVIKGPAAAKEGVQLTPEAVDQTAQAALKDRATLSGIGRNPANLSAVLNRMAEIGSGTDLAGNRAQFNADKKSLDKIVPQYDAITSFTKNAVQQGHILKGLAAKVDATGVPVFERWIRAGKKSILGDPDVSEFDAQMQLYRTEAARILTTPNLTGVLTDSARHEVEAFLSNQSSAAQISRVVDRLENDFTIRENSLTDQIRDINARLAKPVTGTGGGTAGNRETVGTATQSSRDADAGRLIIRSNFGGDIERAKAEYADSLAQVNALPPTQRAIAKDYTDKLKAGIDSWSSNPGSVSLDGTASSKSGLPRIGGTTAPAARAAPQSGAPARVISDADFNALPSGTLFIAPDGTQRRKP